MTHETFSPTPNLRSAPLPTKKTLRMRQNLPYQAYRFAAFHLRTVRMVAKGHH
jgi:hypothetical protein